MSKTAKIIMISTNSHQNKTFKFIAGHLPDELEGKVVRVKWALSFSIANLIGGLPKILRKIAKERMEAMIEFTYKRRIARFDRFKGFNGLIRFSLQLRSKILYHLFHALFNLEQPDLVIVWGGLALPVSAAAAAAKDFGCKVLYCENGYLPKTIVMDPTGVNAKNSLVGKERVFYEQVDPEADRLSALFSQTLVQRPLKKADASLENQLETSERHHKLPEAYIFLPLQVHDDSQVLLYSPRFKRMPDLIRYCFEEIDKYNRLHQTAIKLVVKEHPSDFGRIDYSDIKEELKEEVFFIQAIGTPELLEGCKAVITINSTVGIEGLFKFKPVITLGDAFYNIAGLVYHLEEGHELSELLEEALATPVDVELTQKFLYYLKYKYLVDFDRRAMETTDPFGFIARISENL